MSCPVVTETTGTSEARGRTSAGAAKVRTSTQVARTRTREDGASSSAENGEYERGP